MLKPKNLSDAILVTHQNCMDGAGCSIVFLRAGGRLSNIRYVTAGRVEQFIKDDPVINSESFLIFADVGFADPKYADILEKRGNCVLIDHHKTSLHLKDRSWCVIDAEESGGSACGSELLRRYLQVNDANTFTLINIIDDHDRWLRKTSCSEDLATFMSFVGQSDFVNRFLDRDVTQELFTSSEREMMDILLRRKKEGIKSCLRSLVRKNLTYGDKTVRAAYVLNSEPNVSALLDAVLVQEKDVDVAIQVSFDRRSISLRSRGDIDVAEIAKYFRGGGHHAASGHPFPPHSFEDIIEVIHG